MNKLLRGLNIYLIGMMGSGKSTVGKFLAHKLEYRFLDTDNTIEMLSQKTINKIFEEDGENAFRTLENQVLGEVSSYLHTVISTGGGIVLKKDNWAHLRDGMVIWLDVPVDVLVDRLKNDHTRPLLKDTDLTQKLRNILEERKSLYQQADITIYVTKKQSTEDIVAEIIQVIPTKIKPEFNPDLN
ncbi:shikimate kinase [Cyanobacterium stanieri LEGE 03274]|uniref:Shikimate kinase n=1 Tax=Cyanobacterium stanieri LEGE 03274 TaxID=1828756 RepID=A0ABR9V6P1_9CHRO|nr:shikimate kinase [Cyanobacterium stanieri]MBE9223550.1 shikimate kinase [Cyanobacterium stanieri LEGE 03274]